MRGQRGHDILRGSLSVTRLVTTSFCLDINHSGTHVYIILILDSQESIPLLNLNRTMC